MPIFSSLSKKEAPLSFIDIGTSSGLTLNFDLYEYAYSGKRNYGESKVKIQSNILEGQFPTFEQIIGAKRKIGIDQNPLDLKIPDNALWLKALIWPDMLERFERMEAAIELAINCPIELYKANNPKEFKILIDQIPVHETLLIYHTHVLYQFTKTERRAFRNMLHEVAKIRDFCYLAVESHLVFDREDYTEKGNLVELTTFDKGNNDSRILAVVNGHGTWIRWK